MAVLTSCWCQRVFSLGPPGPSPPCGGTTPPLPAWRPSSAEVGPQVRHRWCELIVKHRYTRAYKDVERFLQEDQAMGVYLYGELMLSEDPRQQQVARRCFELTKEQMERSSAEVVAEMLF